MGHKTLHESAAEILAASVAAAGKEPVPMVGMQPTDLGGEMMTGDVVSPGAATAQSMKASPKAGRPGAPAEEMKALPVEGEEAEDSEEKEEDSEKLMESLIAEHGPELVLENLITEYGDAHVFGAIMEEYNQEFGEDLVNEKFGETLVEQYGEEVIAKNLFESIIGDFHEQEFSDEDFATLSENSNAFITEMQTLSEEDFDNYIENLTEEEIVTAIQLSSLNEEYLVEFLKKIGKALKKGVKAVGKVAGKVLKNPLFSAVASFALPGVGGLAAKLGGKLASTALGKAVGAVGSKIAGSALGKGVAALGKTAIGGALKGAAGQAIKSGIGSKLTGGSFSQGAKAGAIGGLVGSAAGAVGSKLGLDKVMTSGIGSKIKGVAGDALTSGIGSKLTGGSFSQGAKAGAIGSVIGSVAKGFGDKISQTTGSQSAGDIASNVASGVADKIANKPKSVSEPADDAGESEAPEQTAVQDDQEEKVAATALPKTQIRTAPALQKAAVAQDDNEDPDSVKNFMKDIRAARAAKNKNVGTNKMVAENDEFNDMNELIEQLSSFDESQLEQFIESLSEDQAKYVAEMLDEATTATNKRNIRGVQDRIDAGKRKDAKNASLTAETERLRKTGIAIDDYGRPMKTTPLSANPPAPTPKYGEKGTGANKGKFWTGKAYQKPSEMSDEDRYGKTGAAIRKAGAKAAIAAGEDPKLGADTAYNMRDKTKEGNLKLAADFKKSLADGAFNADADAAPAGSGSRPLTDAEIQKLKRDAQGANAPTQTYNDNEPETSAYKTSSGEPNWDDISTWQNDPIASGSSGAPKKTEKNLGDVAYDTVKRAGRTGIRQGIGGAILGQDWKQSAKAGAAGQAAYDIGKGILNVLRGKKQKQQDMSESIEESNMNGEETTMETTELTEEQIREERMLAIKEAVKQFKGNMREDVDALFNGESLSEEFRAKATLIFESAVSSRVETILEEIVQQNDEVLANAYEEIKGQLTEQVDEYLNYVVEQWMEENQVAIETGLRAELAEDFISGLRSLFQEHYIEIPEEKVDVAETLAAELDQAAEYVETVHQHVAKQDETIADLQEQLNVVKKAIVTESFCAGLTAVQAGKMKALAEGVEFTTEGDFEEKLAVLRENYFPTKVQVKSEVKELQRVALNEEPEVESTNNIMNRYVQAIAKTAPKA